MTAYKNSETRAPHKGIVIMSPTLVDQRTDDCAVSNVWCIKASILHAIVSGQHSPKTEMNAFYKKWVPMWYTGYMYS